MIAGERIAMRMYSGAALKRAMKTRDHIESVCEEDHVDRKQPNSRSSMV
jgi:hypothetical protein